MTIAPPTPAWTCAKCGQKNAGWTSACGRCQFTYAMPDSTAPAPAALSHRLIGLQRFIERMVSQKAWPESDSVAAHQAECCASAAAALAALREENARLNEGLDMVAEERDVFQKSALYWVASASDEKHRAERAEAEVARAYQTLAVYGVPQERARNIGNGVEVLMQRVNKERMAIEARIAALEAEREGLAKDAERYRWLRKAQSQVARTWIVINNRNQYGEHQLDTAIDAARAKEK
jgi:hypothetical protein